MTSFSRRKTFASVPRTVRGQPIVINGDPKGENFLYCNGSNVFIRNLRDTSVCDVYFEHSKDTMVAKYSPSRFYIASGDITGKVRVWDTVNKEHILKIEHSALSGCVKDLDWTSDSQKICAVGDGRQAFGRVFTYDSGNSVGEISGHSKSINSVGVKQTRPMRIVTGSEDFAVNFFEGPPFKFTCSKNDHDNFVNCVRFSPDGGIFITGGADGKLFMYEGKTSELIGELGEPKAHSGGIYAMCFNADGKKLLTVSGDKTAKIWDIGLKTVETEFVLGKQVNDMQVACLWQGDFILTLSLSGYINYLDPSNPAQPSKIIKGHNKPLMALAVTADGSRLYTASSDGLIISWDAATSENDDFKGKGHTNQVTDMVLDEEFLISVGIDDTIQFTPAASLEYSGNAVKLESQPRAVDSKGGVTVVACVNHIIVMQAPGTKLSTLPVDSEPMSVSIRPGGTEVAVGSRKNLTIYNLAGGKLTVKRTEDEPEVGAVDYSPDGAWLAAAFKNNVRMYDTEEFKNIIRGWGEQHTAKVTSLKWSPDSRRFVSSSVDSFIIMWEQGKFQGSKPCIRAHPLSHANRVNWLDNSTVVTVGQDSCVVIWDVTD